jgi:hypothetical protein
MLKDVSQRCVPWAPVPSLEGLKAQGQKGEPKLTLRWDTNRLSPLYLGDIACGP